MNRIIVGLAVRFDNFQSACGSGITIRRLGRPSSQCHGRLGFVQRQDKIVLKFANPATKFLGGHGNSIGYDMRRASEVFHRHVGMCREADLVVAGCAILESILDLWPAGRLGVADRGIREGILRSLIGANDTGERSRAALRDAVSPDIAGRDGRARG